MYSLKEILDTKDIKYRYADTQKQYLTLLEEHQLENARYDLKTYISVIFNSDKKDGEAYSFDPYHEVLITELWKFLTGETNNLMFLLPPRAGKSELGSIIIPTWLVGIMSDWVLFYGGKTPYEIIQSSYSDSLLKRFFSAQVSYVETEIWKRIFPQIRVAPAMGQRYGSQFSRGGLQMDFIADVGSPLGTFRETGGNYKKAAIIQMIPVGGAATGKGADIIVLDDMIKDDITADSPLQRQKLYDWYQSTLYSRAMDRHGRSAKFLALNTKWHEDDLTSRLEDSGEWRVVRFPAFAYPENNELRHNQDKRKEDEVLSKRMSGTYNRVAKSYGKTSRRFVTLYQQIAVPLGGNIIKGKWIQFYKEKPKVDIKIISIDLPFKGTKKDVEEAAKETTSFAVFETWGYNAFENKYYLLDQRRGRYAFVAQEEIFIDFAEENSDVDWIYIEDAATAQSLLSRMEDRFFNIELVPPKESKALRLRLVEHLYQQKRVYYPDPYENPWVKNNIEEITKFPAHKFKDTVDTASMALEKLKKLSDDDGSMDALSKM